VKDYEAHIEDTHADHRGYAWCGAPLAGGEFVFRNIDHAAMNGRGNGRLVPCPECRNAVIKALMGVRHCRPQ
jgi:hypothetical protein